MNALTFVWRLYLLIVAAWWMALLVVVCAIAWAIYEGWRWARPRYLAWRNERQLSNRDSGAPRLARYPSAAAWSRRICSEHEYTIASVTLRDHIDAETEGDRSPIAGRPARHRRAAVSTRRAG
jgi:hypothetical protein